MPISYVKLDHTLYSINYGIYMYEVSVIPLKYRTLSAKFSNTKI